MGHLYLKTLKRKGKVRTMVIFGRIQITSSITVDVGDFAPYYCSIQKTSVSNSESLVGLILFPLSRRQWGFHFFESSGRDTIIRNATMHARCMSANHTCHEEIELTELDTAFPFGCHERLDCWWGYFVVPSSCSVLGCSVVNKSRYMYLTTSPDRCRDYHMPHGNHMLENNDRDP